MGQLANMDLLGHKDQGVKRVTSVIRDQPEAREYRDHQDLLVPRDLQEQRVMGDLKVPQDYQAQRELKDQEDTLDLPVH